jgi:hypothetical protein
MQALRWAFGVSCQRGRGALARTVGVGIGQTITVLGDCHTGLESLEGVLAGGPDKAEKIERESLGKVREIVARFMFIVKAESCPEALRGYHGAIQGRSDMMGVSLFEHIAHPLEGVAELVTSLAILSVAPIGVMAPLEASKTGQSH